MTDPRIREAANAIECVLLVSGEPVRLDQLGEATQAPPEVVIAAIELVQQEYADRGLEIQAVAGGYQLGTRPAYAEAGRRYLGAADSCTTRPPRFCAPSGCAIWAPCRRSKRSAAGRRTPPRRERRSTPAASHEVPPDCIRPCGGRGCPGAGG